MRQNATKTNGFIIVEFRGPMVFTVFGFLPRKVSADDDVDDDGTDATDDTALNETSSKKKRDVGSRRLAGEKSTSVQLLFCFALARLSSS